MRLAMLMLLCGAGAARGEEPCAHETEVVQRVTGELAEQEARRSPYVRLTRPRLEALQHQLDECKARAARKAEEQAARDAQEEARAKDAADKQARLDAMQEDPKLMEMAISLTICVLQDERRSALTEIATEKKYARIGGYENKAKIYGLQQRIRKADELIAEERKNLASWKGRAKLWACTDKVVRGLLLCRGDDPPPDLCGGQKVSDLLSFVGGVDEAGDE